MSRAPTAKERAQQIFGDWIHDKACSLKSSPRGHWAQLTLVLLYHSAVICHDWIIIGTSLLKFRYSKIRALRRSALYRLVYVTQLRKAAEKRPTSAIEYFRKDVVPATPRLSNSSLQSAFYLFLWS